jgi:hypothetical protein
MGPSPIQPHHLPRPSQNAPYLVALTIAPLINLSISIDIFNNFNRVSKFQLPIVNWIASLSEFMLGGILVLLAINLLRTFFLGHHHIRKTLLAFGILSTLYWLLNIITVTVGIHSFNAGSFFLLKIATGLYCSLNMIFLFWYWFIDYPGQVRHLHVPDHPCEIVFPTESAMVEPRRPPGFLDYLYLTVMTSNTLGPPENHSPSGARVKGLQLLHSSMMLVLLGIVISRAVNTLN